MKLLSFYLFCNLLLNCNISLSPPCQLSLLRKAEYSHPKSTIASLEKLELQLESLLQSIQQGDKIFYIDQIHPEKGILLERKSQLTREEVIENFAKKDSYYSSAYECRGCLKDILQNLCSIEVHYIWKSKESVTVRIHFPEDPEKDEFALSSDWVWMGNRWYLTSGL